MRGLRPWLISARSHLELEVFKAPSELGRRKAVWMISLSSLSHVLKHEEEKNKIPATLQWVYPPRYEPDPAMQPLVEDISECAPCAPMVYSYLKGKGKA